MTVCGGLVVSFLTFVYMPLMIMACWHVFTDAASPYASIGTLVVYAIVSSLLNMLFFKTGLEHLALEFYHGPSWFNASLKASLPMLRHLFDEKVLRPKAEARAAKLRAQIALHSDSPSSVLYK